MIVAFVAMVMIVDLLLLHFVCFLAAFVNNFDVIVEDRGNDRYHVSLDNSSSNDLRSPDTNIHNALER